MLLLLPTSWLALFLIFRELAARRWIGSDWRFSFSLATVAWGALLTFGTETLSLGTMLNAPAVRLFWLFANAILWGGLYLWHRRSRADIGVCTFYNEFKELCKWPMDARVMLGASLVFAMFLAGIALLTTTTNWDSLTYHMARVMHWVQQQSVAHYPTSLEGQLYMGPWSAFVQAHLWLLWGNDQFENMLQWSAMAGCLVIATLLVGQLRSGETAAGWRTQAFAALLIVTLPTGIVESITTQTDYTTGFWLMSVASLGLAWCNEPANRVYASGFGAALGLGVLTKFTMLIYAAPIGLATLLALVWKQRDAFWRILPASTFALALCIVIVLPHFIRNEVLFGSVIGTQSSQAGNGVAHLSASGIVFNVVHNIQLHASTGIRELSVQLNRAPRAIGWWLTGRRPDDPDLSVRSSTYEPLDEYFVFDSFGPSPWHVALIGLAMVLGLASLRRNWLPMLGMGLAFTGFVLLCAALRWQIFNSRYHLPALLLFMPLVATLLVPRMPPWLVSAIATILLIFGIVVVAKDASRPIFDPAWRAKPRLRQLLSFQGEDQFYEPLRLVVRQIMAAGCSEVGLKLLGDDPEYALWLMLREAGFKGEIHHQFVEGRSSRLSGTGRMPDVIVTTYRGGRTGDRFPTHTEIGPFTLHWSARISELRAKGVN